MAALLANLRQQRAGDAGAARRAGGRPAPGLVLAVLIGVNVGPNLTYVGSLATLLWRRVLEGAGAAPSTREFHALGAVSTPPCLVGAVLALWAGLQFMG